MDEHNELPDDLSQWPENNWDLFNLDSQNVSFNDLRRAYSKLIKRFRPETHPEHFQRIQDAFETLRDVIQSGNKPNPEAQQKSDSNKEQELQNRRAKRQNEFLNELYNKYIYKADWDGAIALLESVIEPDNPTPEKLEEISDLGEIPYLYMFWLLYTINPSDEDNFPNIFHYLISGEEAANPEDGMSISIKTFLFFLERQRLPYQSNVYEFALDHLDFPAILILFKIRWLNLRFDDDSEDVDVILNDLKRVKSRFIQNDLKKWARLNIEAVEHLLWINNDNAPKAIKDCMDEVSLFPDYRDYFEEKLDEIDQMEQTVFSLKSMPVVLPIDIDAIQTLLLMSGNSVFSRYRRMILKTVSDLADDVLRAFMVYDYLSMHHALVASRLCELLHEMFLTRHEKDNEQDEENDKEGENAEAQTDNVLKRILQIVESYQYDYRSCRLSLIKYLLEEKLDPVKVSVLISNYIKDPPEESSSKTDVEMLKKWHAELVNDGTVILTYYTIMSSEINGMEKYDDEDD